MPSPFERIAEEKLDRVIESGAWDDIEGKGKPLDLESYFDAPEGERMGNHVLKNAGFMPPEVTMASEIATLKTLEEKTTDPAGKKRYRTERLTRETELAIRRERRFLR